MEWYILKSVAVLATLLLFYKLLLEKENMHSFKRFYLLVAVVASLGIPLITITTYVEPATGNSEPVVFHFSEEASVAEKRSFADYLPFIFWAVYALGVFFFSVKFIRNLRELLIKIKTNSKDKKGKYTRVLLREKVDPHTFFSYIFLNLRKYEQGQIPKEVIIHEEAHAQQKHSLDILFVELLQIVFWMNPLIILLKDAVKLNHEFLADRAVIQKGIKTAGYQNTLLSFSSGHLHSDLVNPITYSSIKKRFKVMKTHTSKKAIWLRGLLLLPLFAVLIYSCSTTEELERPAGDPAFQSQAQEVATPEMIVEYNRLARLYNSKADNLVEINDYDKMRRIYDLMSPEQKRTAENLPKVEFIEVVEDEQATPEISPDQIKNSDNLPEVEILEAIENQKLTSQMIEEYNKLVKQYNSIPNEEFSLPQEDANRMMYIRSRMTPEQKEEAEQIKFDVPPPPPPAPAPEANPAPQTPQVPERNNVEVPPAPPVPVQGNKPPPPPPPPSPLESVEKWIEEEAVFYYNGKRTTSQNVLEIVQKNNGKNLDVQVQEDSSGKIVRILDKE